MKTEIPAWKKWFVLLCSIPLSSCSSLSSTEGDTYRFLLTDKEDQTQISVSFLPDGRIHVDKYSPDSKFESLDLTSLQLEEKLRKDGTYVPESVELFFPEKEDLDWPGYTVNPSFWEMPGSKFRFFKNGDEIPKKEAIGLHGLGIVRPWRNSDSSLKQEFRDESWTIQINAEKSPVENHIRINCRLTHVGSNVVHVSPVLISWYEDSYGPPFYSKIQFDPPCENVVSGESERLSWRMETSKPGKTILARHSIREGNKTAIDFSVDLQNPFTEKGINQKDNLDFYFEIYELEDETVDYRGYSLTREISVVWPEGAIRSIFDSKEACAE